MTATLTFIAGPAGEFRYRAGRFMVAIVLARGGYRWAITEGGVERASGAAWTLLRAKEACAGWIQREEGK